MAPLIPGFGPVEMIICMIPLALLIGGVVLAVVLSKNKSAPPPAAGPGWLPDPTQRHQLRYWNGTAWASAVSDDGVQSDDPV